MGNVDLIHFIPNLHKQKVKSAPPPSVPKLRISGWGIRPALLRIRLAAHNGVCGLSGDNLLTPGNQAHLNDTRDGKTVCLQPAPKHGLFSDAGVASAGTRRAAEQPHMTTRLWPPSPLLPLLPSLSVPLRFSISSGGHSSGSRTTSFL